MSTTNQKVPCGGFELDNTLKLSNNKLTTVAGGGVSEYDKELGNSFEDWQNSTNNPYDCIIYKINVEGKIFESVAPSNVSMEVTYSFGDYYLVVNQRYSTLHLTNKVLSKDIEQFYFASHVVEYNKISPEYLSNGYLINEGERGIGLSTELPTDVLVVNLGKNNSYLSYSSAIIAGSNNENVSHLAIGNHNINVDAIGDSNKGTEGYLAVAIGDDNTNDHGMDCLFLGNRLTGFPNADNCVYLGMYSSAIRQNPDTNKKAIFVVGNGKNSINLHNAIEVYTDNIYVNSPMICDKIILKSPDNTLFYLTVSNDGTLSATKVDS